MDHKDEKLGYVGMKNWVRMDEKLVHSDMNVGSQRGEILGQCGMKNSVTEG